MHTLRPLPRALNLRRLLLLAPIVAIASLAAPLPATAGVVAASGAACTIVGTSGDDKLVGTSGSDVICGLGGDDVINGAGGNDVVNGGTGNDVVRGGTGDDRVLGSAGADRVDGGAGTDRVEGGGGNDTITGGDGGDLVLGGGGNDDLDGQAGKDTLNGGVGTNWCTINATDIEKACVYDKASPAAVGLEILPASVDVTSADATVRVRVRITDDTGVDRIDLKATPWGPGNGFSFYGARLVSGTVRDGTWEARTVIRRFSAATQFKFEAHYRDRVGRHGATWFEDPRLTVINRDPDTHPPTIRSIGISDRSLDVRTQAATVTLTARVTDSRSGVQRTQVCLQLPGTDHLQISGCAEMELVSGDLHDGRWRGEYTMPRGVVGGTWNLTADARDKVGNSADYLGEDLHREWEAETIPLDRDPNVHLLPDARVSVLGTKETTPAWIKTVKVDRTTVDTLPQGHRVTVYVRAMDAAGEGINYVDGSLSIPGGEIGSPYFYQAHSSPYQGTRTDGWWKLHFILPQGTPPGRYALSLGVADKVHLRFFSTPAWPVRDGVTPLSASSVLTTGGAAWSGAITIVHNPAG